MKFISSVLIIALAVLLSCRAGDSERGPAASVNNPKGGTHIAKVVEAGCGMCIFGMADASCELAVKIDGKVYRVEGSKLDDHGDAHAADGMCMVPRRAYVEGRIEGDKFLAQKVELQE